MQKQELLRTIEILFWENSFSDLSMDMVAQKLGMKKPSLYYHFPSKEAMFLEVLEQSFERYREFLREVLAPLTPSPSPSEERGVNSVPLLLLKEKGLGDEGIAKLILFPLQTQNLFAIASQKGYCQMEDIRQKIEERFLELETEKLRICQERFGWNTAHAKLFFVLVEGLSKKACLENCEGERKEEMIGEIKKLFFGA